MHLTRGRAADPVQDRELTARLLETAAGGVPSVRVWAPPRHVAFGRRDTRESGYDRACRAAERAGFPPIERSVGGRAVAYSGETLAFAVATPRDDRECSIDDRYTAVGRAVRQALRDLGAAVTTGEPAASFCPGDHSVRVKAGGKLTGLAQRVRADAALVAGCLVPTAADSAVLSRVLTPTYDALAVDFDPASVGSVEAAGGPTDTTQIRRAVELALCASVCESDPRGTNNTPRGTNDTPHGTDDAHESHATHGSHATRGSTSDSHDERSADTDTSVRERFPEVTVSRVGNETPTAGG